MIEQAKAMDYGFDNIFTGGPTPTPSAIALPNGRQGGQFDEMDDDMGALHETEGILRYSVE